MWQIEIYPKSYDENIDMVAIQSALTAAGIGNSVHENSVYVDPSEVNEALEVINSLGYETDEDETEDEEFWFDGE